MYLVPRGHQASGNCNIQDSIILTRLSPKLTRSGISVVHPDSPLNPSLCSSASRRPASSGLTPSSSPASPSRKYQVTAHPGPRSNSLRCPTCSQAVRVFRRQVNDLAAGPTYPAVGVQSGMSARLLRPGTHCQQRVIHVLSASESQPPSPVCRRRCSPSLRKACAGPTCLLS